MTLNYLLCVPFGEWILKAPSSDSPRTFKSFSGSCLFSPWEHVFCFCSPNSRNVWGVCPDRLGSFRGGWGDAEDSGSFGDTTWACSFSGTGFLVVAKFQFGTTSVCPTCCPPTVDGRSPFRATLRTPWNDPISLYLTNVMVSTIVSKTDVALRSMGPKRSFEGALGVNRATIVYLRNFIIQIGPTIPSMGG